MRFRRVGEDVDAPWDASLDALARCDRSMDARATAERARVKINDRTRASATVCASGTRGEGHAAAHRARCFFVSWGTVDES